MAGLARWWRARPWALVAFLVLAARPARAQLPAFLVKDIDAVPIVVSSDPGNFVTIGGTTFFAAFTPSAGRELWRTDGTAAGTMLLKDINPGPDDSSPSRLTVVGGVFFFRA